jgi:hypothetical protein
MHALDPFQEDNGRGIQCRNSSPRMFAHCDCQPDTFKLGLLYAQAERTCKCLAFHRIVFLPDHCSRRRVKTRSRAAATVEVKGEITRQVLQNNDWAQAGKPTEFYATSRPRPDDSKNLSQGKGAPHQNVGKIVAVKAFENRRGQ